MVDKYGKQLSLLEGRAGFACMMMMVEGIVLGGSLLLMIDNKVVVWESLNQSSRRLVVYTIVKAMSDVADVEGVELLV